MKRFVIGSLVGVAMLAATPLTLPPMAQRSYAQTSDSQLQELGELFSKGVQQTQQGQNLEAIETFEQALAIAKKIQDREKEASINVGIAFNYNSIGKRQEALNFYNEGLIIFRELGDRSLEAQILNSIGQVYSNIGKPQEALKYYQEALPISRELGDRSGEAVTLNNIGGVYDDIGQPQEALKYYDRALPILRELGDRSLEATTLNNIGLVYSNIGQPQEALKNYQDALAIKRELGDRSGEATTLSNIGAVYGDIGQPQEALKYLQEALAMRRELGDRPGEAATLNNIGQVYSDIGQPQEALKYYEDALPISREVGDRSWVARTLNNIGLVYNNIGKPQEALKYYQEALPILREVGDRSGEAITLNNIGVVYNDIGEPESALEYFQQALLIRKEVGDRSGEAITLNNIGAVYEHIGQLEEALKYYQDALPIKREVGDRRGEATILNNIGGVYDDIGKPQEALKNYEQALAISREVGDRSGVAITLNNIGVVYDDIGKPQEALEYYEQALPISREVGDRRLEAQILNNIGTVYRDIDRPQEALKYYQDALPISREVGDRSWEAAILKNMGFVFQDTDQPEEAIENWQQSVQITLQMRAGLQQQNRKAFLRTETRLETPIALVDLLIDQNQPEEAFKWYNLATTFELADYARLLDAKVKNPEAQKLIDDWQEKRQRLQYLYPRVEKEWTAQLSQQINQLTAETNELAETAKNRYPEVAELFETTPQDIDKLKANIAPGTLVIQPVLLTGVKKVPDSMAIFLVSRDKATFVKKVPIDAQEFDGLLAEYRAQLENPTAHEYFSKGKLLYDRLIRPVEAEIAAASPKQLAIIATGKLRYIPFETLYHAENKQYLLEKYPIHYLTRISANRPTQGETTSATPRQILAFGNPMPAQIDLQGAEVEAKTIVEIFSGELFIRERATLATFQEKSPRFTLLHLATHGCFQKGGCPNLGMEANTILFANGETFNIASAAGLGLENADLIALSACQTAMKADSNGEEIAGVAYLFERAGAGAVMASLWRMEDEATKEITIEFYKNIKGGMSKVEALRQAKLSHTDDHPFHWSPLILIGDGS
ncbi:MAG: CHAT domain-containing tetratricopeptide repeat protein [Cyanobacteriota bacterium]|nr:CHAT domain-containing tetratricopeptide repeat protein [Cyanobacteriota bacterium]